MVWLVLFVSSCLLEGRFLSPSLSEFKVHPAKRVVGSYYRRTVMNFSYIIFELHKSVILNRWFLGNILIWLIALTCSLLASSLFYLKPCVRIPFKKIHRNPKKEILQLDFLGEQW